MMPLLEEAAVVVERGLDLFSGVLLSPRVSSMSVLQWECTAQTDKKYQLGRIQVSCEGYDYPDDPYILRGSCGVSEGVFVCGHASQ